MLKSTNGIIGHMFRESAWSIERPGILGLCSTANPVLALIDHLDKLLCDQFHPSWLVLRGIDGDPARLLTPQSRGVAFCSVATLLAHLKVRVVDRYQYYPWCLSVLASEAPESLRRRMAANVHSLKQRPCCGDSAFSIPFAQGLRSDTDALQEAAFLRQTFARVPSSNIGMEELGICSGHSMLCNS